MPSLTTTSTPADLTITPRDRRFGRAAAQSRWWLAGQPIATAFYNALSVTFPRGEAFFIESVRAHRDGADPKLTLEINAFIKQEVMHTREHVAFNRRVTDAGYDITELDRAVEETLALTKGRPPILNLAVTMALEHYTGIMAQQMLANPKHFAKADGDTAEMWRWHAIEEIEHKGVAYDTWLHATRDWSAWQRWKVRSLLMLVVTARFWPRRIKGMRQLLAQDGISGWRTDLAILSFLFGNPGMLRGIALPWLSYFRPGFHPWQHDDRALIALADSDYADALIPIAA